MREILKKIKDELPKVEAIPDRMAAFRAEEAILVADIKQLSQKVAEGDGKLLQKLGILREQLANLPGKFQQLQKEDSEELGNLAYAVGEMYPALCQEYSKERCRVIEAVEEFLKKFGCNAYTISEISRQVAREAVTVNKLERARMVFYGLNIGQPVDKNLTISRANFALDQFGECSK